jgi:hypothetical protein
MTESMPGPLEGRDASLEHDYQTLLRRNRALGERLIELEREMSARSQRHADELAEAQREIDRLRAEIDNRAHEAERLQAEVDRLEANAEGLEAELALATTSPGRSTAVWRVLVLDATARASLAACRALGRAGHEVGAAGHTPTSLVTRSRFTARYHQIPGPSATQESFRNSVRSLIAAHGYEVLVVVDDITLARLAPVSLPVPTFPALGPGFERLTDKIGLEALCNDAGVAYPRTFVPADEDEVEDLVDRVGLPVVIKAARSAIARDDQRLGSDAGVRHHEGATIVDDPAAALAAFTAFRRDGLDPILQEFVHRREKINLSIMRRGGRSEMRFTYRVLRDVPLTGGIAMAAETIRPTEGVGAEAVTALERICDAAGYDGLANGEFCRAPDGRLYLIEVNPRLWGSTWFAERLGQRVVERGVRLALGLPALPETPYPAGRRFHHLAGELRWLRLQGPRVEPLRELARTVRPWDVFDGDLLSDPRPILDYALSGLRGSRSRR